MRVFLIAALLSLSVAATAAERFETVNIVIHSDAPLAAWQIEITGTMTLVGVENGEHPAYPRAPYYDREAARAGELDRIVIASFSTAADLPSGTTRIVTLHVLKDAASTLNARLVTAAQPDGRPIDARLSMKYPGETP